MFLFFPRPPGGPVLRIHCFDVVASRNGAFDQCFVVDDGRWL